MTTAPKPETVAESEAEAIAKAKAEAEATAKPKAKAEQIVRAKAEAEEIAKAKARVEAIAKAKAEAEQIAKTKAEAEEIVKAEAKQHGLKATTAAIAPPAVSSTFVASDGRFEKLASGIVRDTQSGLDWYAGPDKNTSWDTARSVGSRFKS